MTHAETAADLTRIGRDVERTILARAVKWHLEDRSTFALSGGGER
ncbi:MAG: hypothetical protein ACRDPC_23570 [Solirubrobacteraceae bacterium]